MTTVALLADIHMRAAYAEEITDALVTIRKRLSERHDPAYTFVLGDLIEDASAAGTDRRRVERVASILEAGPSPVTYLHGNHDVGNLSRSTLLDTLDQDRSYGIRTVAGQPFVFLDSTVNGAGSRGALGTAQREWLRDAVPPDAVVVVHHPVGPFELVENPWFREYPERAYLWDRKELLDLLADRALATVSGHIHRTAYTRFRGLPHVSVSAVSKERPDTPVSGTYAILSVSDHVSVRIYQQGTETASFVLVE